jgi:N-acetylneuraminic acid mutarotase
MYDPSSGIWEEKAQLNTARRSAPACVLDGKIYIFGGSVGGGSGIQLNSLEVFDPAKNEWTVLQASSRSRYYCTMNGANGKLYVIGGTENEPAPYHNVDLVEEYDPATDLWTTKSSMSIPLAFMTSCVYENKVYVVGGDPSATPTMDRFVNLVYDPASDTWENFEQMPIKVHFHGACVHENKMYVCGGLLTADGLESYAVYEYDFSNKEWTLNSKMELPRGDFWGAAGPFFLNAFTYKDKLYLTNGIVLAAYELGTKVAEDKAPLVTSISQNYPNPFNPTTTIKFSLRNRDFVTLELFNNRGQSVSVLSATVLDAGTHSFTWNASDYPSGVYFYRIVTPEFSQTRKMLLLQ